MKGTLQNNKYVRFLLISTLISCTFFFLNLTVGLDQAKNSIKKGVSSTSYKDDEYVRGDLPPASSAQLMEDTPLYQIEKFWQRFGEILIKYSPPKELKINNEKPKGCKLETNLIDPVYDGELYSEAMLSECIDLNYKDYKELIRLHKKFVKHLPEDYGSKLANSYYKNDGIVMVGGGKYSIMTTLVIHILRQQGTTLPIEVMIPHGEKDDDFCTKIEDLNAKCIKPIISESLWKTLDLQSFQIKVISLISSTFRNILYLDSDDYPLFNLDHIFESEVFQEYGFISWPDFWRRSTSPAFYKISGKHIGGRVRNNIDTFSPSIKFSTGHENLFADVAYHDRKGALADGSSETSSIMFDKVRHAKTLMLSLYYNVNGPRAYYHLLSQGNFGEGDKETFVAAANTLDLPYYQLKTKPKIGGELLHGGKTPRGCSMIQYDLVQDFELYKEATSKFGSKGTEGESKYDLNKVVSFFNDKNQKPMFLHYNLGKMDPLQLNVFFERRFGYDLKAVGFDFEFKNMELMHSALCSKSDAVTTIKYAYLKDSKMDEVCGNLENILKKMGETSDKVVIH